jgi:maltose O-acetyltransferase
MKKLMRRLKDRKIKKIFCQKVSVDPNQLTTMSGIACTNTGTSDMISIGNHCTLGCLLQALYGGKINIGNNTYIGPQTIIQSKESVTIGDNVIIANNVLIVDNNNHPVEPEMRLKMSACNDFLHDELWTWKYAESKPIVIESNVWIGRDSRILKGVHIGEGSIVGLGAVVTKDVPPYTVVAGNPARVVKHLSSPIGDNIE